MSSLWFRNGCATFCRSTILAGMVALWSGIAAAQGGVLADGRMLARLADDGSLAQVHWPQVGAYGQFPYGDGPRWGISVGDTVLWSDDAGWRAGETAWDVDEYRGTVPMAHDDQDISATVTYAIGEAGRRLSIGIEVAGVDDPQVVWESGHALNATAPAEGVALTEPMPVVAGSGDPVDTIIIARPVSISRNLFDTLHADGVRSPEEWRMLGDGVWLGVWARQRVLSKGVVVEGGDAEPLEAFGYGAMRSQIVVNGDEVDGRLRAELVLTFARSFEELATWMNAEFVIGQRGATASPRRFERPYLRAQELVMALKSRLKALQDAASGGIILRPPGDGPTTPVDTVAAAQALYGLSYSNDRHTANALAAFLLSQLTVSTDSVRPLGSAYGRVLVNGEPAHPHWEVELLPAASIVWAITEHAGMMDLSGRDAYLRTVKPQVELAADFLEAWSHPLLDRVGFLERLALWKRDAVLRDIAAAQVGLDSAIALFTMLRLEVPESWTQTSARARRALAARGIHAFAPWDVESIPGGPHFRLTEYSGTDELVALLEGQDTRVQRQTGLLSAGYQARKGIDGVRIRRETLPETAETVLKTGYLELDVPDTREMARLLAILFQSYHSVP